MANFINPLSSIGGFQNQALTRFTRPQGTGPKEGLSRTAQETVDAGTPDSGLGKVMERSSRQHNLYLAALKAQQQRQAPTVEPTYTSGGGVSSGVRRAAGGPLTGRYNLLAGADRALQAANAAFRKQFGYDMKINSGGRTYAEQARAYALYKAGKGNLAARPGTSQHESGRAIDLGGAFQNAGSREHRWLQANAGRWGFKWTGKNFKQFEPWHWEFVG